LSSFQLNPLLTNGVQYSPFNLVVNAKGDFLYVANLASNSVSVIKLPEFKLFDTVVNVGSEPSDLVLSPGGDLLYVSLFDEEAVSMVDTTTNKVVGSSIAVGSDPTAVAVSPDGNFVYVSNGNLGSTDNGTVSVIQTSDNTVVATVEVGLAPNDLVVVPDGGFVYVANLGSNSVSVIDTNTNMVVDTLTVGDRPFSITTVSTNPVASIAPEVFVFVANQGSNTLSIINASERKVISTFSDVSNPTGIIGFNGGIFVTQQTGQIGGGSFNVIALSCSDTKDTWASCAVAGTGVMPAGIAVTLANNDADGVSGTADTDSDNDGITDDDETSVDSTATQSAIGLSNEGLNDPDGDGLINSFDLDSDGDCIPDHFEAGGGNDIDRDGLSDDFVDVDMDGHHDEHDPDQTGNKLPLPDTDKDGIPDFLDQDSDNDGRTDAEEAGGLDENGDGIHDELRDFNPGTLLSDGLADACQPGTGAPLPILDMNSNGVPDHLEAESNNGSSSCALAAPGAGASIPLYLLIPAFILINRLWRKRTN